MAWNLLNRKRFDDQERRAMKKSGSAIKGAAVVVGMWLAGTASAETIKVAMDNEAYPPFYSQQADGSWKGWEIDLLEAVCDQMKVTCQVERMAWDGLIPALQQKQVDVIWSSMTINAERRQVIDFSHFYYKTEDVIIGAKDDTRPVDCAKLDSLKGRAIGAQGGSIYASYLDAAAPAGVEVKSYDVMDNVLADLSSGRIDYALEGRTTFAHFLLDHPDYEVKSACPGNDILGMGIGAGLRKPDSALRDRISAAIMAVTQDGTWDRITARYPAVKDILGKP